MNKGWVTFVVIKSSCVDFTLTYLDVVLENEQLHFLGSSSSPIVYVDVG